MPDPAPILVALIVAALAAAGIRVTADPARAGGAGVLAVGLGFLLGCLLLGLRPHWPPKEALDRLLLTLLPIVLGVELLAALPGWLSCCLAAATATRIERILVWLLRGGVVASAAFLLLYHTVYVADLAGPGSRLWSPGETWLTFAALDAALAAVWSVLALTTRHGPARAAPLALAVAATGGALTVMLSGVAGDGQLGLALAAALIGAIALPGPPASRGMLGVGTVGLFALVIIGRFFGDLTTLNAMLLFFAPALCAVPELPYLRKLSPWLRVVMAAALTAVPVAVALSLAWAEPERPADRPATELPELGPQDYFIGP